MVYAVAELEKAASSIGVQVLIEGELPESERIQRVFLLSGVECLLNAYQHARATKLRVAIQWNKQRRMILFRYTNNGDRPPHRIQPTGGLARVRAAVEEARGTMRVCDLPEFCLEIELPMP